MSESPIPEKPPQPDIMLPDPKKLILSASPHIQCADTVPGIMRTVLICLIPPAAASIYFFGFHAVRILLLTTLFCMAFEWICCKLAGKTSTLGDYSAALTGVLLAMNLPPGVPWWICLIGAFIAIVVAKAIYGGLGQNPFNPAAVARVALLVGFAGPMTAWVTPCQGFFPDAEKAPAAIQVHETERKPDFTTGATPLSLAKMAKTPEEIQALQTPDLLKQCFFGQTQGSLGETSALAVLIGGIALILLKIISWHIPAAMLGTTLIFTWIVSKADPSLTPGPLFHLCSGGMMLAAFFMATDMVTSPTTRRGKLIFGSSIGIIACVIRIWGGYPEGVSFAILIMNALVPLIDRICYKRPFGWHPSSAAAYTMRRGEVK